jgi:hypothetical protein
MSFTCLIFLFSLYKKAGIGKRKKPEVKYVVAKKGGGTFLRNSSVSRSSVGIALLINEHAH